MLKSHLRLPIKLTVSALLMTLPAATFGQILPFNALQPGNIVVSRTVYTGDANTVKIGMPLPPNCPSTAVCSKPATNDGTFPFVWNNAKADSSFGITSPIFLDQMTPTGTLINFFTVPTTHSTSFPSKSEVALNLSQDGKYITFMAYNAPPNTIDVSNSNTPVVVDPTNPVGTSFYRSVVQVDSQGVFTFTPTNAYSGNNGRAAFLANGYYYMVGNSNNGTTTGDNLIFSTGAEIATPGQPGTTVPQQIGNFSITQVNDPATGKPYAADKLGKDNNFRGLTIFNNTMYVTKGSGGNGINTLYQVGTAGTLPTLATAANTKLTIVPGFPTTLAKNADAQYPFGIWFANANTVYIADEGDGVIANAGQSPTAGLQKWVRGMDGVWKRVYVLQAGLQLGVPYGVTGYPTALNPSTDGLRNITGRVNADGTATIWAITSTVSANGDQGADPTRLVMINDILANTSPAVAGGEQFTILKTSGFGELLRGVSLTPGTTQLTQAAGQALVVSSANTSGNIAQGSLASAWGIDLATSTPLVGGLPTAAAGTSVSITDGSGKTTAAQLVYVSPGQVNFFVPATVAAGKATVAVTSGSGVVSTGNVTIAAVAPGIFTFTGGGLAAADVFRSSGGLQTLEQTYAIATDLSVVPNPIKGLKTDAVYLVLYGTGISGAGVGNVQVTVNGTSVPVLYAGKQGAYAGLDQINFQVPVSLAGKGVVTIQVTAGGIAANPVTIAVQ